MVPWRKFLVLLTAVSVVVLPLYAVEYFQAADEESTCVQDTASVNPIQLENKSDCNCTIETKQQQSPPIKIKKKVERKNFPEKKPQICIGFLSCRRYDLLEQSMESIINHMENVEPDIRYEVVLVDNGQKYNGSEAAEAAENIFRTDILSRFQFEKYMVSYQNYGIGFGLNSIFFGLCRAPFILSMEDDWVVYVSDQIPPNVCRRDKFNKRVVNMSMQVLQADSDLIGVFLRDVLASPQDEERSTESGLNYLLVKGTNTEERIMLSYANGGVVLNSKVLQLIGKHHPESVSGDSEPNYKISTVQNGKYSAVLYESGKPPDFTVQKRITALKHLGSNRRVQRIP